MVSLHSGRPLKGTKSTKSPVLNSGVLLCLIGLFVCEAAAPLGTILTELCRYWFSRPVRSVRSQHLVAADCIYCKAVNWMKFFPKMFMFLMEKTKIDFAHILVLKLTYILFLTCQQLGMLTVYLFAPCPHWPDMPKMLPLDLDRGSLWGENSSENLWIQIVYYEMVYPIRKANLLYRSP